MSRPLRPIGAAELARRLRGIAAEPDKRFAFFIGAGCSLSCKIPAAWSLVRDDWLPRLRKLRDPHRQDLHEWAREALARSNGHVYDPDNPAASYGAVIEEYSSIKRTGNARSSGSARGAWRALHGIAPSPDRRPRARSPAGRVPGRDRDRPARQPDHQSGRAGPSGGGRRASPGLTLARK